MQIPSESEEEMLIRSVPLKVGFRRWELRVFESADGYVVRAFCDHKGRVGTYSVSLRRRGALDLYKRENAAESLLRLVKSDIRRRVLR